MKLKFLPLFSILFPLLSFAGDVSGVRDGQLRQNQEVWQAWDSEKNRWLEVVEFWHSYADRRGGITWGGK